MSIVGYCRLCVWVVCGRRPIGYATTIIDLPNSLSCFQVQGGDVRIAHRVEAEQHFSSDDERMVAKHRFAIVRSPHASCAQNLPLGREPWKWIRPERPT